MPEIFQLFTLAPVLRGLVAMMVAGTGFPLCGVMVVRLGLIPLRYMMMHGVILGGAVALAAGVPLVPAVIAVNMLMVGIMLVFSEGNMHGFTGASAATMVLSMALASTITHVCDVPAKDTLSLLWGSPFTLSVQDIGILVLLALLLVLYIIFNFQNILALFFNRETAAAMGVRVTFHYTLMVAIVALTVALAMKLLGAFLIDALLILPVQCAAAHLRLSSRGSSVKKLFTAGSAFGFIFSSAGYCTAVLADLPPGATIALLSGITYSIYIMLLHRKDKGQDRRKQS